MFESSIPKDRGITYFTYEHSMFGEGKREEVVYFTYDGDGVENATPQLAIGGLDSIFPPEVMERFREMEMAKQEAWSRGEERTIWRTLRDDFVDAGDKV